MPPFDPVLRSHANWDLEGSGGGPGPRFGELDESGAVDRGLPSVHPDLGIISVSTHGSGTGAADRHHVRPAAVAFRPHL